MVLAMKKQARSRVRSEPVVMWKAPPEGFVNINVDVAIFSSRANPLSINFPTEITRSFYKLPTTI
jgi:hypothetical protein